MNYTEITDEMMMAAEEFWDTASKRVIREAHRMGLYIDENEIGYNTFLFDLFENGEYIPTSEEIAESIKEYIG